MKVFRTYFLKRRLPGVHADVEEFVRSCYYGGRCEVYRWDRADVNLFDINSQYPWSMKGLIPVAYRARSTRIPDDDAQGIGFYEADIEYPETYAPALPWYMGKLFFPVGKMNVRASSMELRRAIDDGAKVKIRRGCVFDVDYLFAEYIDEIYEMKRAAGANGDAALYYVAKLLLNTLYGKFGQRRDQVAFALDPGTMYLFGDQGPRVWPMERGLCFYFTESTAPHILPHIAAAITARARLRILDYIRAAGEVYYTDTDSIFTPNQVDTSDRLGDMAFEGNGDFRAFGVKEYVFKGVPALKGIPLTVTDPRTGEKTTDYSPAFKYFDLEMVKYLRMAGFMESIRAGKSTLRYVEVTKQKHAIVPKRARDGKYSTRPWRPDEIINQISRK